MHIVYINTYIAYFMHDLFAPFCIILCSKSVSTDYMQRAWPPMWFAHICMYVYMYAGMFANGNYTFNYWQWKYSEAFTFILMSKFVCPLLCDDVLCYMLCYVILCYVIYSAAMKF